MYTGIAMIMIAFLGFFASKAESKVGLLTYIILAFVLMANLMIFTLMVNLGSTTLETNFQQQCKEVMPYFHKNIYESFGCTYKYT